MKYQLAVAIAWSVTIAGAAFAQEVKPYSPAVGRDYPTNVYFGDTHLHTSISVDGFGDGMPHLGRLA